MKILTKSTVLFVVICFAATLRGDRGGRMKLSFQQFDAVRVLRYDARSRLVRSAAGVEYRTQSGQNRVNRHEIFVFPSGEWRRLQQFKRPGYLLITARFNRREYILKNGRKRGIKLYYRAQILGHYRSVAAVPQLYARRVDTRKTVKTINVTREQLKKTKDQKFYRLERGRNRRRAVYRTWFIDAASLHSKSGGKLAKRFKLQLRINRTVIRAAYDPSNRTSQPLGGFRYYERYGAVIGYSPQ